jgi:sugar lactone lactonase YvrE
MLSKQLNFYVRYGVVAGAVALLAACGGGGGGGSGSFPMIPSAQDQSQPEPPAPAAATHAVGGVVTGLVGNLVLQNNAGDDLKITADGNFSFTTPVTQDGTYDVKVRTQPLWQFCTVAHGSGAVASDVIDVTVACSAAVAQVTTIAGSGVTGSDDGHGAAATFNLPSGIALDKDGVLLVSDTANNLVRKITAYGDVSTFAGDGTSASVDGTGTAASLALVSGIAIAPSGDIYASELSGGRIRMITPKGEVTTFAGNGINTNVDGDGILAGFQFPQALAVDSIGNIYVAEPTTNVIRKITPTGHVTTFAGSGVAGFADGTGVAASFNQPYSIAVDAADNLFVADTGNQRIRKITPAGVVVPFAGSGAFGATDGPGNTASFWNPAGVALDSAGNVYVSDATSHLLRRITPAGTVSTLAGQSGIAGNQDGIGAVATFSVVVGLTVGADGTIYVTENGGGNRIRKIAPIQAP